jgi:5-methylcytosine-specific restriction protein A
MPKWLAAFVLERADGRCDRCARPLAELGYSRQHRRSHGMGGRAGAELHTAANVVVLCGSATTPGGCHNRAENAARAQCEREGFVIKGEAQRPEDVPILLHGAVWVLPSADGWVPAQAPPDAA